MALKLKVMKQKRCFTLAITLSATIAVLCNCSAIAQNITTSFEDPTDKDTSDGQIMIQGLTPNTEYTLSYSQTSDKKKSLIGPKSITTDVNGILTIGDLSDGKYENFIITNGGTSKFIKTTIALKGVGVATQSTKFFGAGYANFTGIQDDNPTGFSQFFARLAQPLNAANGIKFNASIKERFIWFRNFIVQLTYANTDKFKLYSFDTLQDKYVNRLDLFSHAYFNGNLSLNIVTFVVPKYWKEKKGDMAHIYLDLITSMATTRVCDSSKGNTAETVKTYIVKNNILGLNLKAAFQNVFDTRFSIEAAAKSYYIFPSTSTFNYKLNPHVENIEDVYSAKNLNKPFTAEKNKPYVEFGVQVLYSTGANPPESGNQDKTSSNSNIFIRYNYITNFAKQAGKRYPNNFFQFQIGYSLDITKLFSNSSGSSTNDTKNENQQ